MIGRGVFGRGVIGRGRRLKAALGISSGERIVGATGDLTGAATDRALYLGDDRIPWSAIAQATWEPPVLDLVVVDEATGRDTPHRLHLAEPGDLPQAIHAQVVASIVVSQRLDLGDGRGALAVARQEADGDIRWRVLFDAGLDPSDPSLRTQADAALSGLRDSLGI